MSKFRVGDRVGPFADGHYAEVIKLGWIMVRHPDGETSVHHEDTLERAEEELFGFRVGDRVRYRSGQTDREDIGIVTWLDPLGEQVYIYWVGDRLVQRHAQWSLREHVRKG